MPSVKIVSDEEATGKVKDIYAEIKKKPVSRYRLLNELLIKIN